MSSKTASRPDTLATANACGVIFRVWRSGIHKGEVVHFHLSSGVTYHRICTGVDMVVAWNRPEFEVRLLPQTRQATAAEYLPIMRGLFNGTGVAVQRIARLPAAAR